MENKVDMADDRVEMIEVPQIEMGTDLKQFTQEQLEIWLDRNRPTGSESPDKRKLWENVSNFWTKRESPELYKEK